MSVKMLLNNPDSSLLSIDGTSYFVIDGATRIITPPTTFKNFGVESDEKSNRVWFECPRLIGDNIDVTTLNVRVNYQNAKGDKDQYIVTDVKADGDLVHFSWLLSRKATMYKGNISFIVCLVKTNSEGVITTEWNTTLCTGAVLGGLEVETPAIPQDVTDVVNQLIYITNNTIVNVEELTTQSLENIKQTELDSIENVKNAPNSLFANAIKGKTSGEVVRVDDVSPVEHTVAVKVRSKNLVRFPYNATSSTSNGITYVVNDDGTVTASGTATGTSNLVLHGVSYSAGVRIPIGRYVVSGAPNQTGCEIALGRFPSKYQMRGADRSRFDKPYVFDITDDTACFDIVLLVEDGTTVDNVVFKPQVEVGETATEYVPYVNPNTVTLNRCGKNLIPFPYVQTSKVENGITFTVNENGSISLKGVAESNADIVLAKAQTNLVLPKTKYFISGGRKTAELRIFANVGDTTVTSAVDTGSGAVFDLTGLNFDYIGCYLRVLSGANVNNVLIKPQLEFGETATEYTPYVESSTHTPNSEGDANVVSVSPTMTLFTDTENVRIDCEYTKDTNLVVQDLLERIKALEGV